MATDALSLVRRLWAHAVWADELLLTALSTSGGEPPEALREYQHLLGADAVWLARLEGRPSTVAVWPELTLDETRALSGEVRSGYAAYLDGLNAELLDSAVAYRNSIGQSFTTPVVDIVTHVALHGQYHRGKINLMLRQSALAPAPTDFIAFVRGVPAARSG
jgi:uncharacterized damage-inducible protein DinB